MIFGPLGDDEAIWKLLECQLRLEPDALKEAELKFKDNFETKFKQYKGFFRLLNLSIGFIH